MANNQKAEEYLTEVMKRVASGRSDDKELSADNIAIPDEKDLHSLEEVESVLETMGDEEFLEMLIRVNEQMEEKNLIPPAFSQVVQESPQIEEPKQEELKEANFNVSMEQEKVVAMEPELNEAAAGLETGGEPLEFEEERKEELELGLAENEQEITITSESEEGGTEGELETKLKEEEAENLGFSNVIDLDDELKNITEGDEEDLIASLDSIVQEIQGENSFAESSADLDTDQEGIGSYDKISFGEEMNGEEEPKEKKSKLQEKEEKKKAAAEAKKKKDAEKKEAAKRKKEEAAAKKAAKPKKEKKPKPPKEPVSPEEIVHIRPMFLVFLASVVAAVVLSAVTISDTFGYRLAVQGAREDLEKGYYIEAFEALNGLDLNGSDKEFYESVRILMRVEKQYRSYVNYSLLDMPNEALDSLVKAVKNYDQYADIASGYGVREELDSILSNVEYALGTYQLNLAAVREWNALEDSNEYTKRIMACTGRY